MIRTESTKARGSGKFLALLASLSMLFAGLTAVVFAPASSATPSGPVTICHATSSYSNPYVVITVNTSSVEEMNRFLSEKGPNGHGTHTGSVFDPATNKSGDDWGDIIPAFTYVALNGDKQEQEFEYPGLNAGSTNILNNGCKIPTYTKTAEVSGEEPICVNPGDDQQDVVIKYEGKGEATGYDPVKAQEEADAEAQANADKDLADQLSKYKDFAYGTCDAPVYKATATAEDGMTICYKGNSFPVSASGSGKATSTVDQPDADAKAQEAADADAAANLATALEAYPGYTEGSCSTGQSFKGTSAATLSEQVCFNETDVTVDASGSGEATSTESQAAADSAAQAIANANAAADMASKKSSLPGATAGTCPTTTTVVEPAVVLPATVPAKPKPATVKAPKPAKVDGGVAGKVGAPQTATVPGAVPAGGGSQAPGLPMWALAMIVVGALGAAGAGMQILGSRK